MIKKLLLLYALVVLAAVGTADAASSTLILDGSTTVGPLAKSFATYFTRKYGQHVTVSESGSGNGAKSLIKNFCLPRNSGIIKNLSFSVNPCISAD